MVQRYPRFPQLLLSLDPQRQYGHADGNKILFGDGSSRWYGHPQKRIIWWDDTCLNDTDRNSNTMAFNTTVLCMYHCPVPLGISKARRTE